MGLLASMRRAKELQYGGPGITDRWSEEPYKYDDEKGELSGNVEQEENNAPRAFSRAEEDMSDEDRKPVADVPRMRQPVNTPNDDEDAAESKESIRRLRDYQTKITAPAPKQKVSPLRWILGAATGAFSPDLGAEIIHGKHRRNMEQYRETQEANKDAAGVEEKIGTILQRRQAAKDSAATRLQTAENTREYHNKKLENDEINNLLKDGFELAPGATEVPAGYTARVIGTRKFAVRSVPKGDEVPAKSIEQLNNLRRQYAKLSGLPDDSVVEFDIAPDNRYPQKTADRVQREISNLTSAITKVVNGTANNLTTMETTRKRGADGLKMAEYRATYRAPGRGTVPKDNSDQIEKDKSTALTAAEKVYAAAVAKAAANPGQKDELERQALNALNKTKAIIQETYVTRASANGSKLRNRIGSTPTGKPKDPLGVR